MRRVLAITLILTLGPLSDLVRAETPSQSLPDLALNTTPIGGLLNGLKGVVKQIEDSGHSLIQQVNVDLGAQQVLMASTLKATITQFETAYAKSLTLTLNQVDVQTQNAYHELERLVNQGKEILNASIIAAQGLIYQTQGAANQLLKVIGFHSAPVYYGFTTRDILAAVNESPSDIEILGFWLKDDTLKKNPAITVADMRIPDGNIDARFDRILVKLPQELHDRLRLDNKPCDPIKTFSVKIQVFYTTHPLLSTKYFFNPVVDSEMTFNGQAVAGQPVYDVTAEFVGDTIQNGFQDVAFSGNGQYVETGCKGSVAASDQWAEPHGWNISNAAAQWIGVDHGSVDSNRSWTGNTAVATGNLHGEDTDWAGNCHGGAHGTLKVTGTYSMPTTTTTHYDYSSPSARSSSNGSIAVPSDANLKLGKIVVRFSRASCNKELDKIEFLVPDDPNRNLDNLPSGNGLFTVHYDRGNLQFAGTDLLARQ